MKKRSVILVCAAVVATSMEATAFQVNTYTTHDQLVTSVAHGGDGNFTVVWDSRATAPNLGVFARRFDEMGLPVGTTIAVSTAGTSTRGAVSGAPDGSFVVAWQQRGTLPDDFVVRAQRFDSLGVPAGASFQVNSFTPNSQRYPDIAHDASGNFVIVWQGFGQDNPDNLGGVFGQRFDSVGAPIGGEFQVNTYTTGNQGGARAVAALPSGGFVVAWHDEDQGAERGGTFAQIYDSAGAPVGGEFQVNTSTEGARGDFGIDIGVDPLGNFTVVYAGDDGVAPNPLGSQILAQRFDSAGSMLGSEFRVNTGSHGFSPAITVRDDGNFLVTYDGRDFDSKAVLGAYLMSDGTPIGKEFRVNSEARGVQDGGVIASNGTDQFFAAWGSNCSIASTKCTESEDGDRHGVFARRWVTTQPTCPTLPRSGCFEAGNSLLKLSQSGGGRMLWKWRSGPAFNVGHVGSPANELTSYVLCVYREDGGAPSLVMGADVPGGGTCGSKPCWKANGKGTNAKYKDSAGTPDGIEKIVIKTGERGKILMKGSGPNLTLPLPIGSFTNLTTQLITGHGDCWEAEFDDARKNDATSFKAKF